ncbi:unnamed protein product [Nezara viridula]|uniref:Uncharacterized protein n=1 Tax=Nezara viridula TaxID=85310 RepID=A0A9P0MDH5_NEZVI|nr:unnamed protein product [Nezara viridula]
MSANYESVEEWCNMDVDVERSGVGIESSIEPLLRAFSGPREEIRHPLYRVLNCEDFLLSILKVNTCSRILKDKSATCVAILSSLLSLSRQKEWKIIISLLKIVLESDFKEKNKFIQDIWSKQELHTMPVDVVLILLNSKPDLVEKQLCNLYSMARKNKNIWQNDCFQCWVFWCSKSAELFHVVSSIFNQFLIYLNANSVILDIVTKFITDVMAECDKNKSNFLSLYPIEYQSFVALLIIEPDFNPYRNAVIEKIKFIKNTDPTDLLLLLSHFPLWMNVFNDL